MFCNSKHISWYLIYSITIGHTHKATKTSFRRLPHLLPDSMGGSSHPALIRVEISGENSQRKKQMGCDIHILCPAPDRNESKLLDGDPLFNRFKFEKSAQHLIIDLLSVFL